MRRLGGAVVHDEKCQGYDDPSAYTGHSAAGPRAFALVRLKGSTVLAALTSVMVAQPAVAPRLRMNAPLPLGWRWAYGCLVVVDSLTLCALETQAITYPGPNERWAVGSPVYPRFVLCFSTVAVPERGAGPRLALGDQPAHSTLQHTVLNHQTPPAESWHSPAATRRRSRAAPPAVTAVPAINDPRVGAPAGEKQSRTTGLTTTSDGAA